MKKIIAFIICLMAAFPVSAFAKNVRITERYMEDSGFYRYFLEDDYYIESNVQLGSVVKNIVKLTYNDYVKVTIYKDGEIQPYSSGEFLYGAGEYTIVVKRDEDIGRISFIIDNSPSEDIDAEEEFYNTVDFVQTYDLEQKMYKESIGTAYSIYSTVPNFAVSNKAVRVYTPKNDRASISIVKDGKELEYKSGKLFTEAGYYTISIAYDMDNSENDDLEEISESDLYGFSEEKMNNAELENPSGNDIYSTVVTVAELKFLIIDKPQNKLNYINSPQDYIISSVLLNGKRLSIEDEKQYKVEEEGLYQITFKGIDGTLPDYRFNFEKDVVAPTLELENINSKGIAKDRLKISKNDNNSQIEISSNNAALDFEANVINIDGLYSIKVIDAAGNSNTYMVNVSKSYHISIIWLLLAIIGAGGGIWLYVRHIKNNIQVR